MATIGSEIFRALGYLLITCFVYTAWKLSYDATTKIGFKEALFHGFLWCAGIALFTSLTLGTHTENNDDDDPFYGRSETVQDYEPTTQQRVANFAYYMTLLYLPVIVGASKGRTKPGLKDTDDKNSL